MKKMIVFALFVAILYACGSSSNSTAQENTPPPPPDGLSIYKQNCIICHGAYGDMGASGAANLSESTLSREGRIAVVTKGRGVMTPFEALLSPEKIEAVTDYTMTLQKKKESE